MKNLKKWLAHAYLHRHSISLIIGSILTIVGYEEVGNSVIDVVNHV